MDAEIRTHQALQEAKPSECPKGDRDNKSEVYFKNRFFQQTEFIYLGLSKKQYIFEMGIGAQPQGGSQGRQSPFFPQARMPGSVCNKALQDAKSTKHTQPFTRERG